MARIPVPTIQRQVDPGVRGLSTRANPSSMGGVLDVAESLRGGAMLLARSRAAEDERQMRAADELEAQQERTRVASTMAQATLDWTSNELERRQHYDPSTGTSYTAPLLKEFDGYVEKTAKGAKSERERELIRARLETLRANLGQSAMVFEAGARTSYAKRTIADTLDKRITTATLDPTQSMDLLAQQAAEINGSLHLGPADKAAAMEQARERIMSAAAVTLADRDPRGFLSAVGFGTTKVGKDGKPVPIDAQEAADRVSRHPVLSQVPPAALRQVIDRARTQVVHMDAQAEAERERAARRAEAAANKRERESNQAYTILSNWARDGIAADPLAAKPLLDKIAGTPYAAAYAEQAKSVASNSAAAMLPLDQQRAQLDQLIAVRTAKGTSPQLEHEIESRSRILASSAKAYKDDPLRAGAERGFIPAVAPLDVTSVETMVQGLPARVEQAQTVATRAGRAVSPLRAEEADKLGELLSTLPPAQRSQRIAQLASSLPPDVGQALAQQINEKDKALGLAFAFATDRTTAGRFTSELLIRGGLAKKDGTSTKGEKTPDVKAASWKAHAAAELQGVFPNQQTERQVAEAAELIMHGIASENGGRLTTRDMDRAVALALGGNLIEHNGRKIPLPAGFDDGALEKRLRSVTPAEIGPTVRAGGVEVPAAEFIKTLPGQQLLPVAKGRFAVLVGGRPVTNASGEPIVIGLQ